MFRKSFAAFLALILVLALIGWREQISSDQDSPDDDTTSLLTVTSSKKTTQAYENLIWTESYSNNGWLSADMARISRKFNEVKDQIPQITYGDDFVINCSDNVEFVSLSIYSNTFESLHSFTDVDKLKTLPHGGYYLIIQVKKQGKYIDSEKEYEYSGYECAYEITIK